MKNYHSHTPRRLGRLLCAGILLLGLLLTACALTDRFSNSTPSPTPTEITSGPGGPNGALADSTSEPMITTPAITPNGSPAPGLPSSVIGPDPYPGLAIGLTDAPDSFPPAPDRDLFQLAAELKLHTEPNSISRIVNTEPVSYQQGRKDNFWLVNFRNLNVYESEFELRLVTPHAYWYVQKGQPILQADLEQASREFEENIYPQVTSSFGHEWSPGIDNDPHLNIIHAQIEGVAGYFSSSDEHPQSIYPHSNQREAIYINSRALHIGDSTYLEVLAHEFQHVIHWANDDSEDTWVNEGLSDLAVSVAGYQASNISHYLRTPGTSLVHWPLDNTDIFAHYGGSALFFHYLSEHYSNDGRLIELVKEPADGIDGVNAYLSRQGYQVTFKEIFADWAVANLLDQPQGPYGYQKLDVQASVGKSLNEFGRIDSEIPQYATDYIELTSLRGPAQIRFQAPTENRLLPTLVGEQGCWWSNSGDSIDSTLSHDADLRGVDQAEFTYQVWHQIEKDWDFGYVQVSTDNGKNWEIIETPNTSPQNPVGNSFGPGYTGSQDWTDERIDLSAYAGTKIKIRFQYITDDAINGSGLCLRGMEIPAVGIKSNDGGWKPNGFILTDNRVKQDYIVRVVQIERDARVTVSDLQLTDKQSNTGTVVIDSPQSLERIIVVVAALAPKTLEHAAYTLTVGPAASLTVPPP